MNNLKSYAIVILILFCAVQTIRLNNAQHERDTLQNAIHQAQNAYKIQLDKQRLREQEAAKRAKQSRSHMEGIMRQKIPKDCRKAVEWMIENK